MHQIVAEVRNGNQAWRAIGFSTTIGGAQRIAREHLKKYTSIMFQVSYRISCTKTGKVFKVAGPPHVVYPRWRWGTSHLSCVPTRKQGD